MKVKKILLRLLLCVFVLAVLFAVGACEPAKKDDGDKISSIAIEPASAALTVGEELNYDDFEITVTYEGKKAPEKVKLTAAMISEDDKLSLSEIGTHSLTVNCMGGTTTLQVTVNPLAMDVTVENASAVYTGEPVLPSVKGAPKDAKIEYTVYSGTSAVEANKVDEAVDAGEYFVQIKISAKNYATVEKTATISIEKAQFDVSELIWSNTGYLYTGTEIQLAATCEGMPEGISLNKFTAKDNQAVKATEKGYYEATANFTGSNKNYTLTSCVLTILHYSQAVLIVNEEVYVAEVFSGIYGSEFKPTVDSENKFKLGADGKMMFRGKEIFVDSTSTYTHFDFYQDSKLYYYSFTICFPLKLKTSTQRRSGTLPLRWLPCIIIRTQARETKGNGTSKIISASAITIPIL